MKNLAVSVVVKYAQSKLKENLWEGVLKIWDDQFDYLKENYPRDALQSTFDLTGVTSSIRNLLSLFCVRPPCTVVCGALVITHRISTDAKGKRSHHTTPHPNVGKEEVKKKSTYHREAATVHGPKK